jgi:hypothetical protein
MICLLTGLLAGLLDAAAALGFFVARGNKQPGMLFRYIASGVFGPAAFGPGNRMVVLGVFFHFLIAMFWVGIFFWAYPRVALLHAHPLVVAAGYGLFVWILMNLVVLPLSRVKPRPFSVSFIVVNILILMITIGLPCVYMVQI